VWAEALTISTHPLTLSETGGVRYVGMTRVDGSSVCECLLDWELVDRETGAARKLPDELR
jgi:acyl-CoA thioesterase FadM